MAYTIKGLNTMKIYFFEIFLKFLKEWIILLKVKQHSVNIFMHAVVRLIMWIA